MISYEGIIRKRLRLKGHAEIPAYVEPVEAAQTPNATAEAEDENEQSVEISKVQLGTENDETQPQGTQSWSEVDEIQPEIKDTRTEAEKRYDETAQRREKELLRKEASKSYRERVEGFNKRLSEEPEHYDLFKTSFTK